MLKVQLIRRTAGDDAQGTFGKLYVLNFICFAGELPWRENAARISCIPEGSYECRWTFSPRFRRNTYRLYNVANRSGVLFHSANYVGDVALGWKCQVQGCIVLGERLGVMKGQRAVLLSRPAVRRFESLMNQKPFMLEVLYA